MLKNISIIGAVSAALLLSGCASKPTAFVFKKGDIPEATIRVHNGAGSPSWSYNESKAFRNALEAAAESTLQKGFKYFAITSPKEIANTKGSLKNTAQELLEACSPSSLLALSIPGAGGLHKCGTHNTRAQFLIAMYNEEQTNFTVINAQKVIDYLKENDLYDNVGVEVQNDN